MKHIKRWQEPFYGIGGFGPAFMYQVAMSYLVTFYVPTQSDVVKGALILAPVILFSVVWLIARVIDALIDVPIATWTDNLRSRWGRRRPLMLLGMVPMIAAYALMWFPPVMNGTALGSGGDVVNLIYLGIISILFFVSYTLTTIPYLSALSEIVPDEKARVRTASWQTFFHTIGYVLAYVLVPILFDKLGKQMTILVLLPSMLTILGPFFVIRESSTKGGDGHRAEPQIPLIKSFVMTLQNRTFRRYIYVYAALFFGLQLFLGGIKYMANDMMGLSDTWLGIMNAAAFAPIPLMLLLFNFITRRRGIRLSIRIALVCFSAAMAVFALGWTGFGIPVNPVYFGITAGVIGSFAIGVFFTVPYTIPAQIAADETALTGKNRTGMYFAVQGLINQIVAALAGSVVLVNIVSIKTSTIDTGSIFVAPIVIAACVLSLVMSIWMKPGTKYAPAKRAVKD
jgi:glycoside/pentoside/hexuronide:cation symporter, GPH family